MSAEFKDMQTPSAASSYIRNVLCRAQIPLEPEDHRTNWEDKPRTHKVYSGAKTIRFRGGLSANFRFIATRALATSMSTCVPSGVGGLLVAALCIALRSTCAMQERGGWYLVSITGTAAVMNSNG